MLLPSDAAAPHLTLYLLDGNGSDGGAGQSTWTSKTDAVRFFAGKLVAVVLPIGGGGTGTCYTNWLRDDSGLGHNQWETFLNREHPQAFPVIRRAPICGLTRPEEVICGSTEEQFRCVCAQFTTNNGKCVLRSRFRPPAR